jgi:hypothetical protein
MKVQLKVLVSHDNITIHNEFVNMDSNQNYTVDPCGNISNSSSWP